jgi:ribosome biogenesis GTPase A
MILVDTPGMMWPKISNANDGYLLAANNAIGKNAYFEEEVARELARILIDSYPQLIHARYNLDITKINPNNLLELIAAKRGITNRNQLMNIERSANILLTDYRHGNIGRISLELPPTSI